MTCYFDDLGHDLLDGLWGGGRTGADMAAMTSNETNTRDFAAFI